jgi:hypothetical protein
MSWVRGSTALSLLLLGACGGQINDLPTWVGFAEDSEDAIVLLAVTPPGSVVLAAGRVESSGWRGKGPSARMRLVARDGFIVAKVSPTLGDQAFAITQVCPEGATVGVDAPPFDHATAFWLVGVAGAPASEASVPLAGRECYVPTGEARLPVLKAIAGRVTYLGKLRVAATERAEPDQPAAKVGVTPEASDDLELPRKFMAQHFPKVTARVVARPLEMMRNVGPE